MATADPAALDALLALQGHDLTLDQLHHRLRTLPERQAVADLERRRSALQAQHAALETQRHPLVREQSRLDDEVTGLRDKMAAEDRRLYGGTITSPRELQAIQDEIAALGRRASELEDRELELMEALEPLDAQVASIDTELTRSAEELASAAAALQARAGEVDAEIADVGAQRETARAGIPADLLHQYEQLRAANGGVGVARLDGGRCQGCHLELAPGERARLARESPDTVVHCEECGRILVR